MGIIITIITWVIAFCVLYFLMNIYGFQVSVLIGLSYVIAVLLLKEEA